MFAFIAAAHAASPSAQGHITLTEFQADTDTVPQYYGEWFELYNNYPGTLDFNGVTLTNSSGQAVTFDRSMLVASGDYLVLGVSDNQASGDSDFNGNVPVDFLYEFSTFNLSSSSDDITIAYDGVVLDEVVWDSSWGVSLDYAHAVSLNAFDLEWANDYALNWCASATFITVSGMYGSPGAYNDYCGSSAGVDNDGDGYSERDGDCRDDDAEINPGSVDGADGVPQSSGGGGNADDDANCDGTRDDGVADDDGDGYTEGDGDCDDTDRDVYPGAVEIEDGIDNDCDGCADGADVDGDGFLAIDACGGDDCDDTDANVNPDGTEVPYNGVDDDCSEDTPEDDLDSDGYPAVDDCDDLDPERAPDVDELCDGVDQDCDGDVDEAAADAGIWYEDADGDGYGGGEGIVACDAPEGAVAEGDDCDDGDAIRFPGNPEVCDAQDNDCDEATFDPLECGEVEDTGESKEDESCGCASGGGLPLGLGALGALFVRRRRALFAEPAAS